MPERDDLAGVPLARTPAQQRSREKVRRALAAAETLARRDGVDAVTLPRVAAEAGLSAGALYQYLPDRDAITAALAARYHARFEALLDDVVDQARQGPLPDPVGFVIDAVARIYREEATTAPLRDLGRASDPDRAAHKRRMARKVEDLLDIAGIDVEDPETVSRVVFTAADAVLHEAFAPGEADPDALLAALRAMLHRYLG